MDAAVVDILRKAGIAGDLEGDFPVIGFLTEGEG